MRRALHWIARIVFLTLFFLLMAPFVRPQDGSTGAIRGVVLDPDGRPIAAAAIALGNSATGAHYAATSDEAGRFAFELLPAGDYSGRAEMKLMSPQVTPQIHVDVGGVAEIQFHLALAGASETVTVSGAPLLVETFLVPSPRWWMRKRLMIFLSTGGALRTCRCLHPE